MENRHLHEIARALFFQMNVLKHLWVNAISKTCFFINRMPSSVLNWTTPYHQLFPNNSLFPIDPKVFVSYNHLLSSSCSFIAALDSISLPNIVYEALSHPGWRSATLDEMKVLDDNGTWDLVLLHTGKKAIGCSWVFAIKFNLDGSIARLKAHLVAKGYAQTYGIDYSDTFSPVAKLTYVCLFISLAASYDWDLHQLDIKNVFLHGDLQEEIYMEQPPRFVTQGEIGKACRLRKSLYGLKQTSYAWLGKFNQEVETFGMQKSKSDHFVFYKNSNFGIILLVVYVDDIVITKSDSKGILSLKFFLHN